MWLCMICMSTLVCSTHGRCELEFAGSCIDNLLSMHIVIVHNVQNSVLLCLRVCDWPIHRMNSTIPLIHIMNITTWLTTNQCCKGQLTRVSEADRASHKHLPSPETGLGTLQNHQATGTYQSGFKPAQDAPKGTIGRLI